MLCFVLGNGVILNVVFCPNKGHYFEPFMCLHAVVKEKNAFTALFCLNSPPPPPPSRNCPVTRCGRRIPGTPPDPAHHLPSRWWRPPTQRQQPQLHQRRQWVQSGPAGVADAAPHAAQRGQCWRAEAHVHPEEPAAAAGGPVPVDGQAAGWLQGQTLEYSSQ